VKGAWHFANADNATAAEASYYRAYTRAFYAVTYLKGGWDSLRHYEILASGAVPFFLNLTQVLDAPTLWPFPKKAVLSAMALLGPNQTLAVEAAVASQAAPLPAAYPTSFDLERYCELHARLLRHTECFLTTRTLARYVLRESGGLNHRTARVLLFFDTNGQDYMTGLLYHGVFSLLGEARVSSYHGALRHMHLPRMPMATLYGGGFTYAARLPELSSTAAEQRAETKRRLREGFFNLIILANAHNECCRADECFHGARKTISAYLERFGENVTIATVDGSDSHGCHNGLWRDLPRTHVHFVREPTLAKVRVAPPSDPLPCESDL